MTQFRIKIAGTARVVDGPDDLAIKPEARFAWLAVLDERRKRLSRGVRYEIEVHDPKRGPITYRDT